MVSTLGWGRPLRFALPLWLVYIPKLAFVVEIRGAMQLWRALGCPPVLAAQRILAPCQASTQQVQSSNMWPAGGCEDLFKGL
jgi:hypothetical protein